MFDDTLIALLNGSEILNDHNPNINQTTNLGWEPTQNYSKSFTFTLHAGRSSSLVLRVVNSGGDYHLRNLNLSYSWEWIARKRDIPVAFRFAAS